MSGLIYYITSKATGRVYVGSTTRSAKQRWAEHMHYLRKGTHHSKHLQRVYAKVHCRIGSSENGGVSHVMRCHCSLPHRQLRNHSASASAQSVRSLPHRQLRKWR